MSSPSAAVNSDAAMVQGRPISSEKNEKILDGMKAMHLGGNTSSSHPTSGMAEPTARQSNKHSNAGRLHTKHCSIYIDTYKPNLNSYRRYILQFHVPRRVKWIYI